MPTTTLLITVSCSRFEFPSCHTHTQYIQDEGTFRHQSCDIALKCSHDIADFDDLVTFHFHVDYAQFFSFLLFVREGGVLVSGFRRATRAIAIQDEGILCMPTSCGIAQEHCCRCFSTRVNCVGGDLMSIFFFSALRSGGRCSSFGVSSCHTRNCNSG